MIKARTDKLRELGYVPEISNVEKADRRLLHAQIEASASLRKTMELMQSYTIAEERSLAELAKVYGPEKENLEQAYSRAFTVKLYDKDWNLFNAYYLVEIDRRSIHHEWAKSAKVYALHLEALDEARKHKAIVYSEAFNLPLHLTTQMI